MPFPFLLCPAEIREQIYRELLSSTLTRCDSGLGDGQSRYDFHLNILRANRQIHWEAKKIFEDNVFIKITTPFFESTEHLSSEGRVVIVTTGEKAKRFTDFHLWVYIDSALSQNGMYSMLICLDDLDAFTDGWHSNNLSYPYLNSQLSVKLTVQDPYTFDRQLPKSLQQRLILPFGVIKNLMVFSVHGHEVLPSIKDAVVKEQGVPDPTREECLEKATTLKEVGIKLLEAGNYRRALQHYFDAFAAIHIHVCGRKRTVHAHEFYTELLRTGKYAGQRGEYIRMVLRVSLVANVILAYLKLEEWAEAHFWGKRSIVIFRQSIIGDEMEDLDADGTPSWLKGMSNVNVPAKVDMGYIFYRTALAARALGKEADVKTLIKAAALYLPNDEAAQANSKAII